MLFTNASLVDAEDTHESQIYAFDVYFPFVICDGLQLCEEGVLLFGIHWVATDGRHTCGAALVRRGCSAPNVSPMAAFCK